MRIILGHNQHAMVPAGGRRAEGGANGWDRIAVFPTAKKVPIHRRWGWGWGAVPTQHPCERARVLLADRVGKPGKATASSYPRCPRGGTTPNYCVARFFQRDRTAPGAFHDANVAAQVGSLGCDWAPWVGRMARRAARDWRGIFQTGKLPACSSKTRLRQTRRGRSHPAARPAGH